MELHEFQRSARQCRFALALKECALDRLRDACTEAIKGDKNAFLLGMAEQAMGAHCAKDTKELYRIQKVLTAKRSSPLLQVKDRGGQLIADSKRAVKRWTEHFRDAFDGKATDMQQLQACAVARHEGRWPTSCPSAPMAR